MGNVKRASGQRNADAKYQAWLKKTRIIVDGDFVADWIDEAQQRYIDAGEGGIKMLAEVLGVTPRTLADAKRRYVRPDLTMVQKLAELLNRQRELDELLPPPGLVGWGGDTGAMYCGDGHPTAPGCGSMFHPHHKGGLCLECHVHRDDESFEPRDIRLAQPRMMLAYG